MDIIVKGLKGFKVYQETEDYITKKFCKFSDIVKEPTVLEFTLSHTHSTRQTLDKVVHLTATLPGMKNPEHLEEIGTKFEESIDLLEDRFGKFIERWKEKSKIGTRYPKKYYLSKEIEKEEGEI